MTIASRRSRDASPVVSLSADSSEDTKRSPASDTPLRYCSVVLTAQEKGPEEREGCKKRPRKDDDA